MTYKAKPIQRAEIREAVESKFRARGNILFHCLLFVLGSGLFLAYLPSAWESQFNFRYANESINAVMLYGILGTSFALNFFRYHFKHGTGYRRHEEETDARLNRQLQRSAPAEWEDQEELIRMQQNDKLKHRRLLFQHLALFIGISSVMIFVQLSNVLRWDWFDWDAMTSSYSITAIWGIGWLAHALRYFFAYGFSAEKRQAKIDAEVAREMASLARSQGQSAGNPSDDMARELQDIDRDVSLDLLLQDDVVQPRSHRSV